jgi:putative 2-oxoglutarate-Fe(II)-dependent oxygenase superfamily protein
MNAALPTVMPILATPLGLAAIPDAEELNPLLRDLFAQRAAADRRAPQNPLRFLSADDLMQWPEPPVQRLAEGVVDAVCSLVSSVSAISEAQLRSCRLETRAWFTVVRTNGSVPAANYPLTTWCAIYCVAAPPPADDRPDSGVVRLYESRLGSTFQDATNAALRIPYSQSHYAWRPVAGSLVIFPASLTHEVALLRAAGELVLVTARCRFVAPGQQGISRW